MSFPVYGRCRIPAFGIGTYELRGDECMASVRCALQTGFRLVDTAAGYKNEELVGEGIRASGVPREELFVVIKVSPRSFVSADTVKQSVEDSIRKLGIRYADVALMHWPGCGGLEPADAAGHSAARRRAYGALREMQAAGAIRWIGVSNFLPRHFADIEAACGISLDKGDAPGDDFPVVNQIELHPLCVQADAVAYGAAHGMVAQQYSPLGQAKPELLEHPKLQEMVRTDFPGFSVADVLVMWGLAQGYCTIVRSKSEAHIAANWRAGTAFFASEEQGGLTRKQHETLRHLRERMGVDAAEDTHFCWFSSQIA